MKIKHLLNIFSLCIVLCVTGCKENSLNVGNSGSYMPSLTARYLSLEGNLNKTLSADGETLDLFVESVETSWKFTDNPNWISLQPQAGSYSEEVVLTAQGNTGSESRTGIFYLKSDVSDWNYEETVSVSQNGATPYITVDERNYSFGGAAGSFPVKVISNCDWDAVSSNSWLTVQKSEDGNTLIMTVEENTSSSYRTTTVTLTYKYSSYLTLSITQFPAEVNVTDDVIIFEKSASGFNTTISSESAWSAEVSASWIKITPSEGKAGETSVTIEVSPNESVNERQGYISILTGTTERLQIEIRQRGLYLESESQISFTSREETKLLTIASNMEWKVSSYPEWVSITPLSGNGATDLEVTSSINPSTQARNGKIIVESPDLDITCEIQVIQSGKSLTPGAKELRFSDLGGETELEIIADGPWTSEVSENWITATPLSATGDTTVKVSVTENNTEDLRIGKITYFFGDNVTVVDVIQDSKYFDIDSSNFTFPAEGGTHTIQMGSNQSWKAEIENNPSWISLSDYSGNGETEITVAVLPNMTVYDREATIIITPQLSQAIRISVKQEGLYLRIDTSAVMFFAKGGESDLITIESNGTPVISVSDNWISIDQVNEKSFKVIVTENTTSNTRKGNIIVSLEEVKDGSGSITLPVEQISSGDTFIIEGYPSDSNWNGVSSGSLTITVNTYPNDSDWNKVSEGSISVTVEDYPEDSNWN